MGAFNNCVRDYSPRSTPLRVNMHDFINQTLGNVVSKASMISSQTKASVSIGVTADAAETAIPWTQM